MSRFTELVVEAAALMWCVIGLEQSFRTTLGRLQSQSRTKLTFRTDASAGAGV